MSEPLQDRKKVQRKVKAMKFQNSVRLPALGNARILIGVVSLLALIAGALVSLPQVEASEFAAPKVKNITHDSAIVSWEQPGDALPCIPYIDNEPTQGESLDHLNGRDRFQVTGLYSESQYDVKIICPVLVPFGGEDNPKISSAATFTTGEFPNDTDHADLLERKPKNGNLMLAWKGHTQFSRCDIFLNGGYLVKTTSGVNRYRVADIEPGMYHTYEVVCLVVDRHGKALKLVEGEPRTYAVPLPPATNLRAKKILENSFRVLWNWPQGATACGVFVTGPDGSYVHRILTTNPKLNLDSLDGGTEYKVEVGCRDSNNDFYSWSEPLFVTTAPAPGALTGLRLVKVSDTSARFAWDAVEGADKYVYSVISAGKQCSDMTPRDYSTPKQRLTFRPLLPDQSFVFCVKAISEEGSDLSRTASLAFTTADFDDGS